MSPNHTSPRVFIGECRDCRIAPNEHKTGNNIRAFKVCWCLAFGIWCLLSLVVARVTLEIALRKEFDYAIPPELTAKVEVGTRVKVPFGPRYVNGYVTELIEQSTHTNLRPIAKIIGAA